MSFIERVWNTQQGLEDRFRRIGRGQYGRVLRLARKPTYDECAAETAGTAGDIAECARVP